MNMMQKKITFGVIIGTRNIFNAQLAVKQRHKVLTQLDQLDIGYVIPDEKATHAGAIETRADAKICAELFKSHRDTIDGVVIILPNFGDELGIVQTLEMAKLDVPEAAAIYERRLVLVRPDGHVAWRGDAPPPDSTALIDRVRGA